LSKAIRPHPAVIALDVNETLSDMQPLSARFEAVGASRHLRATWFASTLRDGFALTAAGAYADFGPVAHAALKAILSHEHGLNRGLDDAARFILAGIPDLLLHPDVRPGIEQLHTRGIRLVDPWDVDGAKRAGLASAWINRDDVPYPEPLAPPDLTCRDLVELATAVGR
jgi:hypothetical protein